MSNESEKVSEGRRKLSRRERQYNPIRSREEVENLLEELNKKYWSSSDPHNPVLYARIQDLKWVLRSKSYISYDG